MSAPLELYLSLNARGHMSLSQVPKRTNDLSSLPRVLIIGGGVTGLTTAWVLLDSGFDVTVVAERWAPASPRITSQIAGALWEWPPAVCGKHTDVISLSNSKRWCMASYHIFDTLASMWPGGSHGVRMRTANFFFDKFVVDMPDQLNKMNEIRSSAIRGFKHDPAIITQHRITPKASIVDSYRHTAPVIDTDAYMIWLRTLVAAKGATLVTRRLHGDLLDTEDEILAEYGADVIVNATGLSGWELAADRTVYPLRGALIRVVNDGVRFPKVTEALCVTHNDDTDTEDIVFIVPRNDNILILGGLAQPNQWTLDLTLSSPEIRRMRERCNTNFVPGLSNAELDDEAPLVQGLRPFRGSNVRVERELRREANGDISKIVHSYGQGGAGFSLSFGCAADVLGLVQQAIRELPPLKMTFDIRASL